MIQLDRRKRIVMDADELFHADEVCRTKGITDAHGKEIADREDGEVQIRPFADELHVESERSIAGVIKIAVAAFDDESAWIAAVRTVGHRAAVNRAGEFDPPEIHFRRAPMVH